jgi:transcriptional regulator with XRE-family HTH domain
MRIKQLREKKGWTQATLAEKVGVSRVHLANIESADAAGHHRAPSPALQAQLEKALGLPPGDLYGRGKENRAMLIAIVKQAITPEFAAATVHGLKRCLDERKAGKASNPSTSRLGAEAAIAKVLEGEPKRRGELSALRKRLNELYGD